MMVQMLFQRLLHPDENKSVKGNTDVWEYFGSQIVTVKDINISCMYQPLETHIGQTSTVMTTIPKIQPVNLSCHQMCVCKMFTFLANKKKQKKRRSWQKK